MPKIGDEAYRIIQFLKSEYGDFPGSYILTETLLPIFDDDEAREKTAIDELLKAGFAVRNSSGDMIALTQEGLDYTPNVRTASEG